MRDMKFEMRESILYVKEDESIGAEKGIQCIQYGIKQKKALLNLNA